MSTPAPSAARGRVHPLWLVSLGTVLLSGAWLATPQYGPWLSNAISAPLIIVALLVCGFKPAAARLSLSSASASVVLGVLFAVLSWWFAPLVARRLPWVGQELHLLYGTLRLTPGPLWGAPILALSVMAEELVWRGVLVDWCESRWSTPRVVLVATIAYAIPMAFSRSLLLVSVALGLGAMLTLQRLRSHTWVTCFVTHLTWNVLVFAVHPVG